METLMRKIKKYQRGGLPLSHSLAMNYGDIPNNSSDALKNAKTLLIAKKYQDQFNTPTISSYTPSSKSQKIANALSNPVTASKFYLNKGYLPDNFGDRNILDNATDILNPAFYANALSNTLRHTKDFIKNPSLDEFGQALGSSLPLMGASETVGLGKFGMDNLKTSVGEKLFGIKDVGYNEIPSSTMKQLRGIQSISRKISTGTPASTLYQEGLDLGLEDQHLKGLFGIGKNDIHDFMNNKVEETLSHSPGVSSSHNNSQNNYFNSRLPNLQGRQSSFIRDFLRRGTVDIGDNPFTFPNNSEPPFLSNSEINPRYNGLINEDNIAGYSRKKTPIQVVNRVRNDINNIADKGLKNLYNKIADIPYESSDYSQELTPSISLSGSKSLKAVSDQVNDAKNQFLQSPKGTVYTGSTNTSHNSYLNQINSLTSLPSDKAGLVFHGYKPMNPLGFLSQAGVDNPTINDYINNEMTKVLKKNNYTGKMYRPYYENNNVMLPQYGAKKLQSGGPIDPATNSDPDYRFFPGGKSVAAVQGWIPAITSNEYGVYRNNYTKGINNVLIQNDKRPGYVGVKYGTNNKADIDIYNADNQPIKNVGMSMNPKEINDYFTNNSSTINQRVNDISKQQKGGYSTMGYKSNSPDRNKKYNVIPSGRITMKGVNFPVLGTADTGEQRLMMPNEEHLFKGASQVKELPLRKRQVGGNQLTDSLAQKQGNIFEPSNDIDGNFDSRFPSQSMNANIQATTNVTTPYNENSTVNFNDFLSAIPGVGMVLDGIATQVDNNKKTADANSKLSNPLSTIPYDNNTNEYYQKGISSYQEGGQTDNSDNSDEFDNYLWDTEDDPNQPNQTDSTDPNTNDVQTEDLQNQDQQPDVVDLKDYTPDDFSIDNGNSTDDENSETSSDDENSESGNVQPSANSNLSNMEGDNEGKAFKYLVGDKGIAPHIAAGIVGNLVQESDLNPDSVDNTGAYGMAQWMGDRKKGLFNFAKAKGKSPSDFNTQLDYLLEEPGESSRALNAVQNTRNSSEAALVWANTYERPNKHYANYNRRINAANQIHQKYINGL